jgi:hypothetical protein
MKWRTIEGEGGPVPVFRAVTRNIKWLREGGERERREEGVIMKLPVLCAMVRLLSELIVLAFSYLEAI